MDDSKKNRIHIATVDQLLMDLHFSTTLDSERNELLSRLNEELFQCFPTARAVFMLNITMNRVIGDPMMGIVLFIPKNTKVEQMFSGSVLHAVTMAVVVWSEPGASFEIIKNRYGTNHEFVQTLDDITWLSGMTADEIKFTTRL